MRVPDETKINDNINSVYYYFLFLFYTLNAGTRKSCQILGFHLLYFFSHICVHCVSVRFLSSFYPFYNIVMITVSFLSFLFLFFIVKFYIAEGQSREQAKQREIHGLNLHCRENRGGEGGQWKNDGKPKERAHGGRHVGWFLYIYLDTWAKIAPPPRLVLLRVFGQIQALHLLPLP